MSVTHYHYRSALLDALPWLDYAFMPAGAAPPQDAAYGHQRHSATVLYAEQATPAKSSEGDAVIATNHQPVAVYTADCLPMLIVDTRKGHVAAAHGGLRGTVAGIHLNVFNELCQLGATPDSLRLVIGPAIGPCCYELGQDVVDDLAHQPRLAKMASALPWQNHQYINDAAKRPQAVAQQHGVWFDLPQLARNMALDWGLTAEQCETINVCTYCMAEACASYRRNSHVGHGYSQRYSWIRRR